MANTNEALNGYILKGCLALLGVIGYLLSDILTNTERRLYSLEERVNANTMHVSALEQAITAGRVRQ